MEAITSFRDEYRFLSNFYYVTVKNTFEPDGLVYPTLEHAFQAAKTTDFVIRKEIMRLATPSGAKAAGRQLTIRNDWEKVKLAVMLDLLRYKFSPEYHLVLAHKLVLTYPHALVERNTWHDTTWGSCSCVICSAQVNHNWLGRLLEHVRLELMIHPSLLKG